MVQHTAVGEQSIQLDDRHEFGKDGHSNMFVGLLFRGFLHPHGKHKMDDKKQNAIQELHSHLQVRLMRYVRATFFLLNIHSLFMCGIAVVAVYVTGPECFNIRFRFDFTIISFGTVTPLMALINMAYARRDKALQLVASLKASMMGLYFIHRDWDISEGGLANHPSLGDNTTPAALHMRNLLLDFSQCVRRFLLHPSIYESTAEMRAMTKRSDVLHVLAMTTSSLGGSMATRDFTQRLTELEHSRVSHKLYMECYQRISHITIANEQFTSKAGYTKAGEGGMSRATGYTRDLIDYLENLRNLRDYHTPVMLRYAVIILICICSVVVAPYFNTYCIPQWTQDGHAQNSCPAGYLAAIIFILILMTLYNVQADLEHLFLQISMDDVFFEIPHEFHDLHVNFKNHQNAHAPSDHAASGWTLSTPVVAAAVAGKEAPSKDPHTPGKDKEAQPHPVLSQSGSSRPSVAHMVVEIPNVPSTNN